MSGYRRVVLAGQLACVSAQLRCVSCPRVPDPPLWPDAAASHPGRGRDVVGTATAHLTRPATHDDRGPSGEGTEVAHVTETQYGWLTPTLAYLFSFLGCLLGLKATARARMLPASGQRARWLILAAGAIGGTGSWVMHFVAMIGFEISGSPHRINPR